MYTLSYMTITSRVLFDAKRSINRIQKADLKIPRIWKTSRDKKPLNVSVSLMRVIG